MPTGEKSFWRNGGRYDYVFVCASGIHLYAQTLSPVSAKDMREKHFDRFSSRPRRGSLDVTTTLHWREKFGGRFVIAKSVGDAGAKACLCVFSFSQLCAHQYACIQSSLLHPALFFPLLYVSPLELYVSDISANLDD